MTLTGVVRILVNDHAFVWRELALMHFVDLEEYWEAIYCCKRNAENTIAYCIRCRV